LTPKCNKQEIKSESIRQLYS